MFEGTEKGDKARGALEREEEGVDKDRDGESLEEEGEEEDGEEEDGGGE